MENQKQQRLSFGQPSQEATVLSRTSQLQKLQSILLSRIFASPPDKSLQVNSKYWQNQCDTFAHYLVEQRHKLFVMMKRFLNSKENSSAVLIGPSQIGKRYTLQHVLHHFDNEYSVIVNSKQQLELLPSEFYRTLKIVYCDALNVSSDTTLINTIVRQLKQEAIYNEDLNTSTNSDQNPTPTKKARTMEDKDEAVVTNFEEENEDDNEVSEEQEKLLAELVECKKQKKVAIIILDDFEILCDKAKKAVYNVLDSAHSKKVSTMVFAITKDVQIMNAMDRRIVSRGFLSRYIQFKPLKSVEDLRIIMRSALILPSAIKGIDSKAIELHNEAIETMLNTSELNKKLEKLLPLQNCVGVLRSIMGDFVAAIHPELFPLSFSEFLEAYKAITKEKTLFILRDLDAVDLAVFITIFKELVSKSKLKVFNSTQIHQAYLRFRNRANQPSYIREVDLFQSDRMILYLPSRKEDIERSIQKLHTHGLIKEASKRKNDPDFTLHYLNPHTIERFIKKNQDYFPSELYQWATQ